MTTPTKQAYDEFQQAFDHYNRELFANSLPPCLITMQREKRSYGYFSSKRFINRTDKQITDEIALNPSYFAVVPLLEILQTLVHEMVHAWQYHHGKPGRRGYHNKQWADKMEAVGLMPSSTGKPGGARTGEKVSDYAIEGGPFMAATDKLLAGAFCVSWLDRFPVAVAQAQDVGLGAALAVHEDLKELVHPVSMQNRSNRLKYRCPSCGAQAWGKPDLKLLCGGEKCHAAPLACQTT